jgi:hypothetical protein
MPLLADEYHGGQITGGVSGGKVSGGQRAGGVRGETAVMSLLFHRIRGRRAPVIIDEALDRLAVQRLGAEH